MKNYLKILVIEFSYQETECLAFFSRKFFHRFFFQEFAGSDVIFNTITGYVAAMNILIFNLRFFCCCRKKAVNKKAILIIFTK